MRLKGVALPGTSCTWTPLDSEGLEITESEKTVVASEDGVVSLDTSPATIWYALKCNRTGYPEEPTEDPSKDASSSLCVKWALVGLIALFMAWL